MGLIEFAKLVSAMRQAQTEFFTGGRKRSTLEAAKRLERRVDQELQHILPAADQPLLIPTQEVTDAN